FLAWPMVQIAWRSLLDNQGRFIGLANYVRYVSTPAIGVSITNSLLVAFLAIAFTVALAFVYAYALTPARLPRSRFFRLVPVPTLRIFAPWLVPGIAFVYTFGNNGIVTRQTGITIGIYGAKGIVLAEIFYCFPHAMLILMAAFAAADARLYDAAAALGASRV